MPAPKTLVIGAAVNYQPAQILPFLASLRASGYAGDVALIVTDTFPHTVDGPFRDVQWVRLPQASLRRRRIRQRLAPLLGPLRSWRLARHPGVPQWALNVVRNYHHPSVSRYAVYLEILRRSAAQWVVLSDVRDVVFQLDPVAGLTEPGLYISTESLRYTLGSEPYNRGWISQAYGDVMIERLAELPVSCSGVTLGDRASVLSYLEQMVREITRLTPRIAFRFGYDQAAHNVIVNRAAPPARIRPLHTLDSAVATINGVYEADLLFDAKGRLLTRNGMQVVSIIHQYDRNPRTRALAEALLAQA